LYLEEFVGELVSV